ncbi:hypothetical protein PVIIG_03891 [Plasmodium vivax India VII]|uniref:Uncharacterized protein n=1 Tax=Plasmodium vivax India VII TaxID=1077284 RepID=A0A0J9S4B9_PLAVI|nr:hypothetical protein PVIIG_03891 [Plasmodium vivax India VII]
MKGKGKSTDAPKGGKTTKRAKVERPTETAKGKTQGNKKRKQGKARKGKEPSSNESDESDVYFYKDLQRWKNNVKVPIWLKKPKDKESLNEFYKNVIKKLLRVKNKIRAYQIEEAYLIDCLRKCLMDLNLNSIRSLDCENYEMVRRLCAGGCSAFSKSDGKNGEKEEDEEDEGKCYKRTKEEADPGDSQKDSLHEPTLKDDSYVDHTTHTRVNCATDKVTPPTGENVNSLVESLKNALSVEQGDQKKDLMRHVFNKVIIPGAFFENNNFCPIFMNLLKLDIYNACCVSGAEMGPKLMSLIQLLNNFDEGVKDAAGKGAEREGVPSGSSVGTQKGDSQQGDAQLRSSPHNEGDNSYREDRLFFQSQTSLFKLSQYCIEKGVVANQQVASFDTIYIYSEKEPQSADSQSQRDSHKGKHKKKLRPLGNLKYSLDTTKKENESLHFINERRAILENDSTRRGLSQCGGSHEEGAALANESVESVKAKESSCGGEVLEILSHSDEKEELQDGEIAPVEEEAIHGGKEAISIEGSAHETEQSFDSAVSSVKGISKFDCGGSHPKCRSTEGAKEDPLNYLQNDWPEFDEGGSAAGRGGLEEGSSLRGGDTKGGEAPREEAPREEASRKATPPTGAEICRLYKESEPGRGNQIDESPLQVAQPSSHSNERSTKLCKRKLPQSDHSSADERQSVQFDTFELFMVNGKIKKKKKQHISNEFEHVPIEVRNSLGKWHDSRCSDFTGAHVRAQLEGSDVERGSSPPDGEIFANRGSSPPDGESFSNRNAHITPSIEKNPPSARPPSGHSQTCQDSDTSVIIQMIHYNRKEDSGSDGGGVNLVEKLPPSAARPKCGAAVSSDLAEEMEGDPYGDADKAKDKDPRSVVGRFSDDASASCVVNVNDYWKGDGAECLPPRVAPHSEVIVLEDDDEEGGADNGVIGGVSGMGSVKGSGMESVKGNVMESVQGNHDSARNCEGAPQTEERTPWVNLPRRDEATAGISIEQPKIRETERRKELSILNLDINKTSNVVLEGLMEFFGLKSKRLSRKILIAELTRIQSYLNEQYGQMAREYHPPMAMQKEHPKLGKGKAVEGGYQTESSLPHRDRAEGGEKSRMCTTGGSATVRDSMGVPLGDVHAEVHPFFEHEEWFDGAPVGGGSADRVGATRGISNQVSTTQGGSNQVDATRRTPPPLNDEEAKSQEDYLNRMKKKIKQMELKSLFERIDEAIGVNEVLHDHIKRDRQIEYSLLKRYLVDCKLSVNREIVMTYCREKHIQVVPKKKAKV